MIATKVFLDRHSSIQLVGVPVLIQYFADLRPHSSLTRDIPRCWQSSQHTSSNGNLNSTGVDATYVLHAPDARPTHYARPASPTKTYAPTNENIYLSIPRCCSLNMPMRPMPWLVLFSNRLTLRTKTSTSETLSIITPNRIQASFSAKAPFVRVILKSH